MGTFSRGIRLGLAGLLAAGLCAGVLVASDAAGADKLSPELQQLLEAGKVREAGALLKKKPAAGGGPAPGAVVSKPSGSGPLAYTCHGGSCSCSGNSDCLSMVSDACKAGSVSCSEDACTCQKD
jgi:hypothetical protein